MNDSQPPTLCSQYPCSRLLKDKPRPERIYLLLDTKLDTLAGIYSELDAYFIDSATLMPIYLLLHLFSFLG